MTAWDRSAIILLGAAGFLFSYDALRQIAIAIHARESLSYLFPVFIDGFIAYGVRAIVLLRHQRFGARLYAWFLFLAATGASLGANALHAITLNDGPQAGRSALHLTDGVVGVLSMLAPLALAGSVHLYILMARTAELSVPDSADNGPGPVREEGLRLERTAVQSALRPPEATITAGVRSLPSGPSAAEDAGPAPVDLQKHEVGQDDGARADESATHAPAGTEGADEVPCDADGPAVGPADDWPTAAPPAAAKTTVVAAVRALADGEMPSVPDDAECPQDREADDEWLAELLPIARAATEKAGRINRDVVGGAVRPHQPISNDRLGVLLGRLKEEEDEAAGTPPAASRALW
ncbi:DUF2637 domain-containing protein [Streptomyces sp. H39-S7]|uniref:DUF2637 domain-containing protein n=1 Tax=Streptomyces sp. H39-S7 TaxID=3004357 RepID=UPI0022AE8497|nr:DUF2637 domain-containing protein [Streptomyces sp. H39-S7]MCZ4118094.1 DUF2637 domain-containing protein [Streptomyces sp. H39-S7]